MELPGIESDLTLAGIVHLECTTVLSGLVVLTGCCNQ